MSLKHTTIEMPGVLSDVLLIEVNPGWCRQAGTLSACDVDLPVGAVLARREDGTYVPYLLAESDDQAVAMLITEAEASTEKRDCVVVRRGCVVAAANLFFIPAASAADKKKAALASFESIGLVPQE